MIPGEYFINPGNIECNANRIVVTIVVVNTGDRPVQIGSHFHFFEINRQLEFDRSLSFGRRLNIASGTAVRFEPGEEKEIQLVNFGGTRTIYGFNNLTSGNTESELQKQKAMGQMESHQFKNKPNEPSDK